MNVYTDKELHLVRGHEGRIEELKMKCLDPKVQATPGVLRGSCVMLAEESLRLAMMRVVKESDFVGAQALLEGASSLTQKNLVNAVRGWEALADSDDPLFEEKGAYLVEGFWHVYCVYILLGQWQPAIELANLAISTKAIGNNERPYSEFTALMMALLREDAVAVDEAKRMLLNWPYEAEPLYLELSELAECVLRRDQVRLNALLATADKRYKRRAKISPTFGYGAEFGTNGYNGIYFDYTTVVICRIAKYFGMTVSIDTAAVPGLFANCGG